MPGARARASSSKYAMGGRPAGESAPVRVPKKDQCVLQPFCTERAVRRGYCREHWLDWRHGDLVERNVHVREHVKHLANGTSYTIPAHVQVRRVRQHKGSPIGVRYKPERHSAYEGVQCAYDECTVQAEATLKDDDKPYCTPHYRKRLYSEIIEDDGLTRNQRNYQANRDAEIQKVREWNQANKDRRAAWASKHKKENRDIYNRRQRAYRAKKKREQEAA